VADTPGTVVDEALAEIVDALGHVEPLLEGLRDFARLNILPGTAVVVQAAIVEHERRVTLLQAGQTALESLLADGYPLLPVHEISQADYADLADNHNSIDVAFDHFAPNTANALRLSAGEVEPKP